MSPKSDTGAWPLDFPEGEIDPGPTGSSRRTLPPSGKADVATMLPYDRTGDGETESHTARVGIARTFNPVEWFKDLFTLAPRDTGSLVFDDDDDARGFGDQADGSASTIFHSIVDEI